MKTVLAHGVFDVLHIGHYRLLECARKMGDRLVVSILSDQFATLYKRKPYHSTYQRMEILQAVRWVDSVVIVDGPGHRAVEKMIARVSPDIYVKGADTRGKFKEEKFLVESGVEIFYMPMVKHEGGTASTTSIMEYQ